MKVILLIMFFLQGEPQPLVQGVPMPDMKTCEKQAHLVNAASMPTELKGKQVNGMAGACLRAKPAGTDT